MEFMKDEDDRRPAGRPLRRNDIVCDTRHSFWTPFGRVSRVIDADTVEVAWGKDGIDVEPAAHLQVHNHYQGFVENGRAEIDPVTHEYTYPDARFIRMPSLRKLKQRAISRGRAAWTRDRERFLADKAAQQAIWDAEDAAEEAARAAAGDVPITA